MTEIPKIFYWQDLAALPVLGLVHDPAWQIKVDQYGWKIMTKPDGSIAGLHQPSGVIVHGQFRNGTHFLVIPAFYTL